MKQYSADLVFGTVLALILIMGLWMMYQISTAPIKEVVTSIVMKR